MRAKTTADASLPAIFDAGALVAYLDSEPGGDAVRQLIEESNRPLYAHAMNLVEVFYHYAREVDVMKARAALEGLAADGIERREDLDAAFCEDTGELKAQWRRVSLADCCGVALARRLGGEFITTDRHELTALEAGGVAQIIFIR